ncbi:DNA ligase [Candidatus Thiodubiliella endoseptemdiera]|uniref:DNA ligase n=1 Tax=Candidatus Thiodubiliella endoseptemdiera TaxID=2738886 RepID=UPI0034DE4295
MKIKTLLFLLFSSCLVFAEKPDLFLLKTYNEKLDVVGWVMSEKLDGIRGFWDGEKLISRGGVILNPPKSWTANFPNFAIDGELWTKRADFEGVSSIVRRKKPDSRWQKVSFNIFEVPNQKGGILQRLKVLQDYLQQHPSKTIRIIQQIPVKSKQQLNDFLNEIISKKGEGIVVRNPKTLYQTGRLSSALKIKKYQDEECTVLEILSGKGKYSNKMGALKCQTKTGKILKIGSGFTDQQRQNPPIIGSEITFKYYGLTNNKKYKHPVFLKIKPKLTH